MDRAFFCPLTITAYSVSSAGSIEKILRFVKMAYTVNAYQPLFNSSCSFLFVLWVAYASTRELYTVTRSLRHLSLSIFPAQLKAPTHVFLTSIPTFLRFFLDIPCLLYYYVVIKSRYFCDVYIHIWQVDWLAREKRYSSQSRYYLRTNISFID